MEEQRRLRDALAEICERQTSPANNGIFEPFIYINDHFAKTGSGQHRESTQEQMPFFAPVDAAGRPSDVKRVDEAPVGCAQ
eukprot:COSAG06_NODE_4692_length_4031_cov_4.370869_5_plen_81_part_00